MKVVITRQNNDGTYDNVGMNNIMLISWLKADYAILRHARRFSSGKMFLLEYYTDHEFYNNKPFKTVFNK